MKLSNAVNQMYKGREKLIILGLTGRTGAGCSKVAEILGKEDFAALDIRDPKHYDYNNAEEEDIYELMSITRNGKVTLSAALLFSPYPQAYFPQLCIIAIVVPGTELGMLGDSGERFLDNMRIEGNISDMLGEALKFTVIN